MRNVLQFYDSAVTWYVIQYDKKPDHIYRRISNFLGQRYHKHLFL